MTHLFSVMFMLMIASVGQSSMKKDIERADELELIVNRGGLILKVSLFLDKILMITSLTMANLLL